MVPEGLIGAGSTIKTASAGMALKPKVTPWRLSRARYASVVLASLIVSVSASNALAWNQLYKDLSNPDAVGDCPNTAQGPCVEWTKTSSNLSTTVYLLIGHTLGDQEVDLRTDAYNAQFTYNDITARNPSLVQTTDSSIDELTVAMTDTQAFDVYGTTDNTFSATAPYHITKSVIRLNKKIVWNRNRDYTCNQAAQICNADARKVMNHEFGHAEGLGHEASTVYSVMRPGPLTFYAVQADDRNGIIAIYGAYP